MTTRRAPKVGLVLGAGGITGIAWLAGAVRAVREQTGWDPATADVICGTSAGAVVATVLAAGQDPNDLLTYAEDPPALAEAIAAATATRPADGIAVPWPGSLGLAASGLVTRDPRRRLASLSGLLPRGMRSGDEIRGLTHTAAQGAAWPRRQQLWLHAWDVRAGRLVTFGREDQPEAEIADAVVASCAVPGYYRPVTIGGRRYVDGGVRSLTNADRLLDQGCDVVVILSPFSSTQRGALIDTAIFGVARTATAARTAREARLLRSAGATVSVMGPTPADIRVMGLNPMERRHSRAVRDSALASVAARAPDLELVASRPPRCAGPCGVGGRFWPRSSLSTRSPAWSPRSRACNGCLVADECWRAAAPTGRSEHAP